MPMIPKPMTDINSESAYEKLKFIPEHYNEIMAAYTDIMEHLKLPVMNDTGGSGGDCLHEVVEVTNPCPAYVQYDLKIKNEYKGLYYTYKDNYGDYNTDSMYISSSENNNVRACILDTLRKYNNEYPNNAISLRGSSSDDYAIFPKLTNEYSGLDYTVILLDKTTGEPVDIQSYTEFDGLDEATYDTVSEIYDIKLALTERNNYSYEPIILGNFYEKLVELRTSIDMSSYLSKLPTPEEFCRMMNVFLGYYFEAKVTVKLLTEEERAEVRNYIQMNTSSNVPLDTPYMYALDVFCHPSTLNRMIDVKYGVAGSYSKGYININNLLQFGRSTGCGDIHDITYIHSTITLVPSDFSGSYVYFKQNESADNSEGAVVMPQTFKLIQSKEGIDRRL